jgi:hypothetical protein
MSHRNICCGTFGASLGRDSNIVLLSVLHRARGGVVPCHKGNATQIPSRMSASMARALECRRASLYVRSSHSFDAHTPLGILHTRFVWHPSIVADVPSGLSLTPLTSVAVLNSAVLPSNIQQHIIPTTRKSASVCRWLLWWCDLEMVTGVCSSASGEWDAPDTIQIILAVVIIRFNSYLSTWQLNSPRGQLQS